MTRKTVWYRAGVMGFVFLCGIQAAYGEDLVVHGTGYAVWHGKKYRCATGKNGIVPGAQRRNGSQTTPAGTFRILHVMYRPDRVTLPPLLCRVQAITPQSVWCCQWTSPFYNQYIETPTSWHHTALYLKEDWFDVVAVLDFNTHGGTLGQTPITRPVQGVGHGIFMHVRKPGYAPSKGCIGLSREDLIYILSTFDPSKDRVVIMAP